VGKGKYSQTVESMKTISKILLAASILLFASFFAGAACQKKGDPVATQIEGEDAPTESPTSGFTHELVVPDDVGPPAPAIFLMTGLKGYTEPCGCTLDVMLGGIDRIVRYREEAAKLVSASVLIDGGDLLFEHKKYEEEEIPQERARVDVIVAGLKRLKPIFTVPGPRDFALGAEFYRSKLNEAGVPTHALNLKILGESIGGVVIHELEKQRVAFVPVVQPSLYEGIADVEASELSLHATLADLKSQELSAIVLVAHGDLAFVKATMKEYPDLHFGLVGHGPRESDQADEVLESFTLEPYDQGRYFGILKLYPQPGSPRFVNARAGSKTELEAVDTQIAHVESSIERLPPATPGKESPMLVNLRNRLTDLQRRREEIRNATIQITEGQSAFLWRSVPMLPGLAVDSNLKKIRDDYNQSLKELNLAVERHVVPVEAGQAEYIGSNQCASCHAPAMKFWEGTAHARALTTLEERNKDFDHTCVSCHVVGYEKPGGSVLGQMEYQRTITGSDPSLTLEITKDLRHVGCESCHGPGSLHRFQPVGADGPQFIKKGSGVETCMECHVPDHSPRFNYDVFVRQITGEGHQLQQ